MFESNLLRCNVKLKVLPCVNRFVSCVSVLMRSLVQLESFLHIVKTCITIYLTNCDDCTGKYGRNIIQKHL